MTIYIGPLAMQKSKFQQKRTMLLIFRNKFLQYRKNRKEHIGTSKKNILSKGTSSKQSLGKTGTYFEHFLFPYEQT